jgi:phosphoglycolate phosphatase-like HAD superfamily hydrolase
MVPPPLFLFDIDGTILRTHGAGREALDEAFARVCGWKDATVGVPIGGSTDSAIVRGVAARFGVAWPDDDAAPWDAQAFEDAYLDGLSRRLATGRAERCPGVTDLLEALVGRAHVALVTGNWPAGARMKLAAVGLDGRFALGAFGDDAVDRNALVPIACARAREAGWSWSRAVVVGDTPADVACARAGGAMAIAVETGFSPSPDLAAAGPDLLIRDLDAGRGAVLALVGLASV